MRTLAKDIINKEGEEVELMGWVAVRRDHGKIIFIDLRDRSGIAQVVFAGGVVVSGAHPPDKLPSVSDLRPEYVIKIIGKVKKRPEAMKNPELATGEFEIQVKELEILNPAETPPLAVDTDGYEIGEETRLKYRYLDLRRPRLQKNLKARHKAIKFIRDYLSERDFIEIETPILTKSTPEGARDFIVPSRLQTGKFYALPQSPQQYKQLLMASGFEKYFQITRCMRDEDTRGDRQPEFTQLDLEMSFVKQEDILQISEAMFTELVETFYPDKTISQKPWPRIDYEEAMDKYGTDKPDIRKDKNDPNELAFAWIVNFPLFERNKNNGHFAPSHHMFTSPLKEDISKLDSDPHSVRAYQHDIVLNGYEVGGGSIRIHNADTQSKIFDLIGFSPQQKEYFSHMLIAFKYGIPPHGGIAPGIDRLMMILENESNIREVIAFPKTGDGRDLMMQAPSEVDKKQLDELNLEINKKK